MGNLKDFTKKSLPQMAVAFGTAAIMNLLARDTDKIGYKRKSKKAFYRRFGKGENDLFRQLRNTPIK